MADTDDVEGQVVATQPLSEEEATLVEELRLLQTASLGNIKDAFRQLLTLSTAVMAVQVALLEAGNYNILAVLDAKSLAILLSFICMFLCVAISFAGQASELIELSTVNALHNFRQYRRRRIRRGNALYGLAGFLFLIGLLAFLISFVSLL